MKVLLIIFSIFLISAEATAVVGEYENDSISFLDAARQIERFHQVKFAFDHQMLSNAKVQKLNFEAPLEQILQQILDPNKFEFEFSEKTVLIIPLRVELKNNVSLNGLIIDESTGEVLPNAVVHLRNSGKYTVTNRDGRFNFLNIPTDTSMIEISYLGYMTQKFKPRQFQDSDDVKINLVNSDEVLSEVTVSDFQQKAFDVSLEPSKLSVRMDDFKPLSSFGEPDVFRALQLLPGISATNETSAGLSIRGSNPQQNLVLFDGFTIYHLDHFFGMFSAINTNVIKDVQVYKGGFGAEYGTRTSGVMDITGKTGNNYKTSGNIALNFISANAVLEVPIGEKLSVLVAARRSYTDVLESGLYNKLFNHVKENNPNSVSLSGEEGIEELQPDFYFYDLNGKITYRIDDKNLISYSMYGGKDNLFINDSNSDTFEGATYKYDSEESNKWGNKGGTIRYARQWSKKLFSDVEVSYSKFFRNQSYNFKYEFDFFQVFDSLIIEGPNAGTFIPDTLFIDEEYEISYDSKNEIKETNIKLESEYKINDANVLNFGLFSIHNKAIDNIIYDKEFTDNNSVSGSLSGAYIQHSFSPTSRTKLISGFRLSKYSISNKSYFEPRLSINHKLSDRVNLKASVGRYYQFAKNINVNDATFTRSSYWWLANDDIPILSSNHYVAGFTFLNAGFTLDVEGYYKTVSGLTEYFLNQYAQDSDDFEQFFQGKGRYFGLEILLKKRIGKVDSWIAYTLSKAENNFDGINFNKYYASNQDQRHEIKWVNMINLKKWTFSTVWIYGKGKPYTLDQINQTDDGVNFFPEINLNTRNTSRIPDYHRLDINVGYNTKLSKRVKLDFGLNLLNVYNRSNVKGFRVFPSFDDSDNELIVTKPIKLLDFTPSLFLNVSF